MKRLSVICLIFTLTLNVAAGHRHGATAADERVIVLLDRSMYISGETIQFSAKILKDGPTAGSTVLYCELITPDGIRTAGAKYPVAENFVKGDLRIPSDLVTGTYYFRAYTKMMRSNGPSGYCYSALKIINPNLKELQPSETGEPGSGRDSIQPESGGILTNLEVYSPNDPITFQVAGRNPDDPALAEYSLAVVPEAAAPSDDHPAPNSSAEAEVPFYPENRGISLTGRLVRNGGNIPVAGALIDLSILGQGKDFMPGFTDSTGRFFFALPSYYGNLDLFVSPAGTNLNGLKLQIDNDFCTLPVKLPAPPFHLSESEEKTALNMAINWQVTSAFSPLRTDTIGKQKQTSVPFYGTPSDIIHIDDFVALPTLEEYFNELPMLMKVRKIKGERKFRATGPESELEVYDPLVLVDMVAVDDPELVLAISPQSLDRIEVVNAPYVKGNQTYGGIVSIFSKRGDMGNIHLPSSGIFLNYMFYHEPESMDILQDTTRNLPDSRNTVYWQAMHDTKMHGNEAGSFKAPDTPGHYLIVARTISSKGSIIRKTGRFEVK